MHRPERAALVRDVKAALGVLDGVDWAEVDAVVGRVVVAFDAEAMTGDDLIATIETVEDAHDAAHERFPHNRPDHPADREPIQRNVFGIIADVAGIGVAITAQTLRFVRIPAEIPGLISIAESQPRVRRFLENRIGRPVTDVTLGAATALTQAFAQGPLGLAVDIAHRAGSVQELESRRAIWERREPDLARAPETVRHVAMDVSTRPTPLPSGPVERSSDRLAVASLGGFAITLGATRDTRRAADLLLTGIPKAATMGREAFAAQLDRKLADHGVITMDVTALRRLDRIDTLVLEANVVTSDSWSLDDVVPLTDRTDELECTLRARRLFDPSNPARVRQAGAWTLAPIAGNETARFPAPANVRRRPGTDRRRVLGLWHGDDLQAQVGVLKEPAALADELVNVARTSGLEVLVGGGGNELAHRLGIAHQPLPGPLVEELRALQEAGHAVMLVGGTDPEALRVADIGLGVVQSGKRTPSAAHLVVGPGLASVWRVVDAVRTARDVSHRSALLALGGASTGGIWAFMGPARTAAQRALLPINGTALVSIALGGLAGVQAGNRNPPRPGPSDAWHEYTPDEALARLASSANGLRPDEQSSRRDLSTARSIRAPVGLVRAALDELANPLTPVLGLGAVLSAAVGSVTDAALVSGVVGVDALVGAVQRVRTDRSMYELEEVGEHTVRVRTAGHTRELVPDSLVVGDVVELEAGNSVPADCRLLDCAALEVDESAITGESLPVAKTVEATPGAPVAERTSMLYDGSVIAAGHAVALIVAVGRDTEAGRSATTAAEPPPSGVERRLAMLTRLTVPVTVVGGAVVTGMGFLYRRPMRRAVSAGVALTVAAVPEGLPMLATVAQVAAARRLASRNALVRNPRALEALGRANQVCFDKTGTLTQGTISLVSVSFGSIDEPLDALSERGRGVLAAALRATPVAGDDALPHATDHAIVVGAAEVGVREVHGVGAWERLEEIPFESRRGYHAVLGNSASDGAFVTVKGAPETLVSRARTWRRGDETVPLDATARREIDNHVERLGRRGLRVLAVAQAPASMDVTLGDGATVTGLELLGFVSLADRVRPTAAAAVRALDAAGVHVTMITGDHPSTAEAIAADLDLLNGRRVLNGSDLDHLTDDELDRVLPDVAVLARVTPLQKVRIVEAYQRAGRSVAMAGDGANDAAAIRLADAGIALGDHRTAAARATADIVIFDSRIETIVDAIAESRAMWDSVRDAVAILVGGNLGEMGFILVGSTTTGTSPLNPRQLLLVNLLTDMAPALAIALREPPDHATEALLCAGPDASLGGALARQIAVRAGATATGATAAWLIARMTGTPTRARTVALAALVGTQLGQTLVVGGRSPLVLGATGASVAALVGAIQTPGISQFFGCRPLGPVGWLTAVCASTGATGASLVAPWALARVGEQIRARRGETDRIELTGSESL